MKLSQIVVPFSLFLLLFGCNSQLGDLDADAGVGGGSSGSGGNSGVGGNSGNSGSGGRAGFGSGGRAGSGSSGRGPELDAGNGGPGDPDASSDAGDAVDLDGGDGPFVTVTSPVDGDLRVPINQTLTATFSDTMDPATISTMTFTLMRGTVPVLGEVTFSGGVGTFVAAFDPDFDLAPNSLFRATITVGAADLTGANLFTDYAWTFTTGSLATQAVVQRPVPTGSASSFAILASAAITNIATSRITGDVGLTPDTGSNISGFSVPATCPEVTGTIYAVDATGPSCTTVSPSVLTDAKADAEIAFLDARAAARGTPQAISGDLNGLTLYPGLYESGTSLQISPGGVLYLDAQGDENAVFVIRSETSITTESSSTVVLTKGTQASNVFWIAGSSVTLGANAIMKGTLIAGTSISLLTGANLEGSALNQGAAAEAITLDAAVITVPSP